LIKSKYDDAEMGDDELAETILNDPSLLAGLGAGLGAGAGAGAGAGTAAGQGMFARGRKVEMVRRMDAVGEEGEREERERERREMERQPEERRDN
jgi:hypothetical protein